MGDQRQDTQPQSQESTRLFPTCATPGCPSLNITHDPSGLCFLCRGRPGEVVACPICNYWFVPGTACEHCLDVARNEENQRRHSETVLTEILGGPRPFDEHVRERFIVRPENEEAVAAVDAFDPRRESLYLYGANGGGKTFLAHVAARRLFGARFSVEILGPGALRRRIARDDLRHEEEEIKALSSVDVLVLDEFGKGKATEGVASWLLEIINRRFDNRKNGMIFTTNLDLNDLAKKLDDDTIPSRLYKMCKVIRVDPPAGVDWRTKTKPAELKNREGK